MPMMSLVEAKVELTMAKAAASEAYFDLHSKAMDASADPNQLTVRAVKDAARNADNAARRMFNAQTNVHLAAARPESQS